MNKNIYIISLILIWFVINIFFYVFSSNYRYFLQSIKYDEVKNYQVDDNFKISIWQLDNKKDNTWSSGTYVSDNLFSWLSNDFGDDKINKFESWNTKIKTEKIKENNTKIKKEENKAEFSGTREKLKLTLIEEDILSALSKYKLKEVDLHWRLFDLTWEYPDDYFEYYNENINLYFFWNKIYSDVRDIFKVLTYELPFSINDANNFWTKSFYINLNSWFDDDYIRVVLQKSNRIFWFKIKKELYEKMKNDLGVIFHK